MKGSKSGDPGRTTFSFGSLSVPKIESLNILNELISKHSCSKLLLKMDAVEASNQDNKSLGVIWNQWQ